MVKNKKAFTLVELLAVIVILAVILVIAVPSIMDTIKESRKGALASSAKLIASSAETAYISNQTLGIEKDIRCEDVSSYNSNDDFTCDLQIVDGKAKVTLIGKGKFEGMAVCGGTKVDAVAIERDKCPVPTVSFSEDRWATIKAAVEAGDTKNYHVGDTKTIDLDIDGNGTDETYTLRIANMSNDWKHCGEDGYSQTACGFVIEFADIITEQKMNLNNTNKGGWPVSAIRKYLNDLDPNDNTDGVIYNALVSEIGDIIIPTMVVSGHGAISGEENFTTTDKLYLLSEREVWGTQLSGDTAGEDTITIQLDYYKNKKVSTSSYSGAKKQYSESDASWWLRSAYSYDTGSFYTVLPSGDWINRSANRTYGVSPAFRLG